MRGRRGVVTSAIAASRGRHTHPSRANEVAEATRRVVAGADSNGGGTALAVPSHVGAGRDDDLLAPWRARPPAHVVASVSR